MVFESLLGARDVEGHPLLMFVAGFSYTFASVFLALLVHADAASILSVSLATIAAVPLVVKVVEFEARMLELFPGSLASRQKRILAIYAWFMLGAILGFSLAFYILPQDLFVQAARLQLEDLGYVARVRAALQGRAVAPGPFWVILGNNLRVYALGILLSFVYGTGGIFLVTWNASVLATLLVQEIRKSGIFTGIAYFLGILPHGALEFAAYFIGGFAGALISVAIFKEGADWGLVADALVLVITGALLLVLGAYVESLAFLLQ